MWIHDPKNSRKASGIINKRSLHNLLSPENLPYMQLAGLHFKPTICIIQEVGIQHLST